MSALGAAISGLQTSQKWLDVISNNVSNSQTVAYKAGRAEFSDLISDGLRSASGPNAGANLGGLNPTQLGLGVTVATIQVLQKQGATQVTGNVTDVAIQGQGMMTVRKGADTLYTRAGNLTFDQQGNLVTSDGGLVQGWSVNITRTGVGAAMIIGVPQLLTTNTAAVGNIQVPNNLVLGPRATSANASPSVKDQGVILKGNLDNNTPQNLNAIYSAAWVPDAVSTAVVYDSLGTAHTIQMSFTQTAATPGAAATWTMSVDDITGGVAPGVNTLNTVAGITFNADGSLANGGGTPAGGTIPIAEVLANGAATPFNFTINIGTDNAFAAPTPGLRDGLTGDYGNGTFNPLTGIYQPVQSVYTQAVDGYPEGTLTGLSFNQTGGIDAQFSNNQTVEVAKLAMSRFSNVDGLTRVGGNYFARTANSGQPQIGTAGSTGFGVIAGGALEASNVDLTVELTNMILAQRMFESNSRVVTAADKVLDALVNLGR